MTSRNIEMAYYINIAEQAWPIHWRPYDATMIAINFQALGGW